MVKFSSSLIVVATLIAGSFASPFAKRTEAQVLADTSDVSSKVTALDALVSNFNGGLSAALSIHTAAQALDTSVKKATTDLKANGHFNEGDSSSVVSAVQALQPKIVALLNHLVAKKEVFQNVPPGGVGQVVEQDIKTLDSSTSDFENGLIAAVTTDQVAKAQAFKTAIDAAFENAIRAYS